MVVTFLGSSLGAPCKMYPGACLGDLDFEKYSAGIAWQEFRRVSWVAIISRRLKDHAHGSFGIPCRETEMKRDVIFHAKRCNAGCVPRCQPEWLSSDKACSSLNLYADPRCLQSCLHLPRSSLPSRCNFGGTLSLQVLFFLLPWQEQHPSPAFCCCCC